MKWQSYPSYKNTGIEWMGSIPEQWGKSALKRNCKLAGRIGFRGYSTEDIVAEEEGALTLSPSNMKDGNINLNKCTYISWEKYYESPEIMVFVNDILMVKTGSTYGKVSYVSNIDYPSTVNPQIMILKEIKILPKYLFYITSSIQFQNLLKLLNTGSTIPTMTQEAVGCIGIPIPSEPEQWQILLFLDRETTRIDSLIAKKQRQIELLQEKRAALISHVVTKGLNPNAKMKDSGIEWLGKIPAHWKISRMKYICSVVGRIGFRGYTTDDQVDHGEGALTLGATHIGENGFIDLSAPVFISWEKYYESPEIMVSKGDILVVQRGSCGRVGYIQDDIGPSTINPSVVLLKNSQILTKYLFYYLFGDYVRSKLDSIIAATAVPMLSQYQIENIPICLPSDEEMVEIVQYLDIETSRVQLLNTTIHNSISKLQEYRTALISAAVTGKIDVRGEVA